MIFKKLNKIQENTDKYLSEISKNAGYEWEIQQRDIDF
jgi:hypothetical protein